MMLQDTKVAPESTTVPAMLSHRGRIDARLQAVVTTDHSVTYAELNRLSRERAERLVAAGVVKGDRVGLLAPNGVDWAVSAYAVLRIGAVLVPLSTLLRPPELLEQLTIASVSHLIAVPSFRDRHYFDDLDLVAPGLATATGAGHRHQGAPALRGLWRTDAWPTARAPVSVVEALEEQVRPADDLVVLFTSGSRGAPKGVIHTQGAALRAVAAGLEARCVGAGERLYIPMPFFWTGGFGQGLLTALVAGATLLTEAEPDPERTLELLARQRATLFRGWPDQASRLAAHPSFAQADLSSLRDGSLAPVLPPDRRPAPGARANLFGMTETFGPYCGDRLDLDLAPGKEGSCGRPFAGVEVRVSDPDTGAELPPNQQGEIWVRGPNLLRAICRRSRASVFTDDGWYRTGDLGRLDAAGYLWSAGRLDDMVKVKGATVYPSEVEAALRAVTAVQAAHVTDVPADNGGREIGALVICSMPVAELREAVRARLSAFKVPTRWFVTPDADEVPMLASSKVDKAALQQLLTDRGCGSSGR